MRDTAQPAVPVSVCAPAQPECLSAPARHLPPQVNQPQEPDAWGTARTAAQQVEQAAQMTRCNCNKRNTLPVTDQQGQICQRGKHILLINFSRLVMQHTCASVLGQNSICMYRIWLGPAERGRRLAPDDDLTLGCAGERGTCIQEASDAAHSSVIPGVMQSGQVGKCNCKTQCTDKATGMPQHGSIPAAAGEGTFGYDAELLLHLACLAVFPRLAAPQRNRQVGWDGDAGVPKQPCFTAILAAAAASTAAVTAATTTAAAAVFRCRAGAEHSAGGCKAG